MFIGFDCSLAWILSEYFDCMYFLLHNFVAECVFLARPPLRMLFRYVYILQENPLWITINKADCFRLFYFLLVKDEHDLR